MNMNSINGYPGWLVVREIGKGSFGTVYEVENEIGGRNSRAALKIIPIPQRKSEWDNLVESGYSSSKISGHFKAQLDSTLQEYRIMSQLRGCRNIVCCEDVACIPKTDEFGWNVLIRMELLTPITSALKIQIDEKTAIKIGIDICTALSECRKYNIIHRDIKPDNIFLSKTRDFKLGDFGIAKSTLQGNVETKIGTYDYMAPEVYYNEEYGQTIDLYSLGLVLYWLLNERYLPFLPTHDDVPSDPEKQEAWLRRFRGEPFPPAKHGSYDLQRIITKACAFNPEERYQTPEEMRKDLIRIANEPRWQCKKCGYVNDERYSVCQSCGNPKNTIIEGWHCLRCGEINNEQLTKCQKCGKPRNENGETWYCKYCGSQNANKYAYCNNCGKPREHRIQWLGLAALAVIIIGVAYLLLRKPTPPPSSSAALVVTPTVTSVVAPTATPSIEIVEPGMGPFHSGLFTFLNGETIIIPDGFTDTNTTGYYKYTSDVEHYFYYFYNDAEDMYILMSECSEEELIRACKTGYVVSPYRSDTPLKIEENLIDALYEDAISFWGEPVYQVRNTDSYVISGFEGERIYYSRVVRVDGVIYSIEFLYPTANRNSCDRIVEATEESFSGMRAAYGSAVSSKYAPTLSNLESLVSSGTAKTKSNIGIKLVLPTENQMLSEPFRAHVDNGKSTGSIYIMPKNQPDNGYIGTVAVGTEVWIVAQTNDFYFFVTDDGQMGWNGKRFFS